MTIIGLVVGVQNVNVKPHVLTYVRNINLDKRMKINYRDYYLHPLGSRMADKSFMMIPSPKDYGEYLQNKRKRKKK
jgi:hypothetical protein|nr:MAG TPA: hypothetical protein [Caudoviricetes sp.]